jgi:hypothetical protein
MVPVGRFPSCLDVSELSDEFAAHLRQRVVESAASTSDEAWLLAIVASSVVRFPRLRAPGGHEQVGSTAEQRMRIESGQPAQTRSGRPSARRGGGSPERRSQQSVIATPPSWWSSDRTSTPRRYRPPVNRRPTL